MNQEKQKDLQEKYLELQFLNSQIKQLSQQLSVLDTQVIELQKIEDSLNDIKKVESYTEMLTPLGPGLFIKTNLKDNKEVLMNVGSGVVVRKDLESALEYVKKQTLEIENIINQIELELSRANINSEVLQQELNKIMKNNEK